MLVGLWGAGGCDGAVNGLRVGVDSGVARFAALRRSGDEICQEQSSGGWDLDLTGTRDPLTMLQSVTAGIHLLMGIAGPEGSRTRRNWTGELQGQ